MRTMLYQTNRATRMYPTIGGSLRQKTASCSAMPATSVCTTMGVTEKGLWHRQSTSRSPTARIRWTIEPEISDKRLAVSAHISQDLIRKWKGKFRKVIRGRLGLLRHTTFYAVAMDATEDGYLKPADDDDVLKRMSDAR
jgi:hypothetical protein